VTSKVLNINKYLISVFNEKTWKIPINLGYLCPNKKADGTGACIYCDSRGAKAPWLKNWMSIEEQFIKGRALVKKFYNANKFLIYFQSYTSTYKDTKTLESIYNKVLSFKDVKGIIISTRPDCINDSLLELLAKLNKKTFMWVELGAQSMHDSSLEWMKRGHDVNCFINMFNKLKANNIKIVAHLIFGLPCETKETMLSSFKKLIELNIDGYKIHPLHIIKNTELHTMHLKENYKLLSKDEYLNLIDEVFNLTPESCVVHRITADIPKTLLVAPLWVLEKNSINNYFKNRFY